MSSRRGFDGKLKISLNHGDIPEDDVLDDLADITNRGIQRSILDADNSIFSIKIDTILAEAVWPNYGLSGGTDGTGRVGKRKEAVVLGLLAKRCG